MMKEERQERREKVLKARTSNLQKISAGLRFGFLMG